VFHPNAFNANARRPALFPTPDEITPKGMTTAMDRENAHILASRRAA
jgi:hypothetical protein